MLHKIDILFLNEILSLNSNAMGIYLLPKYEFSYKPSELSP